MVLISWRAEARADLANIHAYIAADDARAADQIVVRISARVDALAEHPHLGRPGRVSGTRELVVGGTPFIVPYWQPRPGEIEILAVIHGARRWPDNLPNP